MFQYLCFPGGGEIWPCGGHNRKYIFRSGLREGNFYAYLGDGGVVR